MMINITTNIFALLTSRQKKNKSLVQNRLSVGLRT